MLHAVGDMHSTRAVPAAIVSWNILQFYDIFAVEQKHVTFNDFRRTSHIPQLPKNVILAYLIPGLVWGIR